MGAYKPWFLNVVLNSSVGPVFQNNTFSLSIFTEWDYLRLKTVSLRYRAEFNQIQTKVKAQSSSALPRTTDKTKHATTLSPQTRFLGFFYLGYVIFVFFQVSFSYSQGSGSGWGWDLKSFLQSGPVSTVSIKHL